MERVRRLIMDRKEIAFLKAVIESYEELGLLTVIDGRRAEVELTYPASSEDVVSALLDDLAKSGILFEEVKHRG